MAITKVTSGVRTLGAGEVVATDLASTIDLSGKTVTLPAASVTSHVTAFDDNQLKEDIALLAFKQATSDSVVKYDLVDQTIDVFEDASGVDASASTGETRNASNYYSGQSLSTTTVWSATLTGSGTSWNNVTSRSLLDNFSTGGTEIRVDIKGGSGGTVLDNVAIVPRSLSTYDGTTTPTSLLFSSSASVTIGADATVTSDWLTFSSTASNDYLGILDFASGGGGTIGYEATGFGNVWKVSDNSYNAQNMPTPYNTSTWGIGFDKVEVRGLSTVDMTLISNSTTAETQPTKADLVMTYTNGVGTATIGSDLTAECSRDGGITWTSFGLSPSSDQGDTGGHTILTAHDLDISGQPSGTSMQYRIKTLNQSASKETRIHAVSLGWS